MNTFKYKDDGLSEEHIKQICRFLDKTYVEGEHQKWHKFSQFKFWHKREMEIGEMWSLLLKRNRMRIG